MGSASLFPNPIDPTWPTASAVISKCGLYRYELVRIWDSTLPRLYWVMLNPSTADAVKSDPTMLKCIGFAKHNGYGSICIMNLFAYRATEPKELCSKQGFVNVEGPENEAYLRSIPRGEVVVCAWGSFVEAQPRFFTRPNVVKGLLKGCILKCVRITKTQPWHPLYVPYGALVDLERGSQNTHPMDEAPKPCSSTSSSS